MSEGVIEGDRIIVLEGPAGGPRGLDQEDQPSQAHRVSGDRYVRANHPNGKSDWELSENELENGITAVDAGERLPWTTAAALSVDAAPGHP